MIEGILSLLFFALAVRVSYGQIFRDPPSY